MPAVRTVLETAGLAALWWYGRWLLDPPTELALDQSILLSGVTALLFAGYTVLSVSLLDLLADRWNAGLLEGRSVDVAKMLVSFASLLFVAMALLLTVTQPPLGLIVMVMVSFLFSLVRLHIQRRLL